MSKSRKNAETNVDVGMDNRIFHFHYDTSTAEIPLMDLELVLSCAQQHLVRQRCDTEQCADLLVIGVAKDGKRYIINQPSVTALEKLTEEYGKREAPRQKRVKNGELREVIVRDMVDSGPTSVVLKGEVVCVCSNGYATIMLEQFDANTKELGALINEMMKLRLLRISNRVNLKALRNIYR